MFLKLKNTTFQSITGIIYDFVTPLVKHNRITITQILGLIFQDYPKPTFLLNLDLDL